MLKWDQTSQSPKTIVKLWPNRWPLKYLTKGFPKRTVSNRGKSKSVLLSVYCVFLQLTKSETLLGISPCLTLAVSCKWLLYSVGSLASKSFFTFERELHLSYIANISKKNHSVSVNSFSGMVTQLLYFQSQKLGQLCLAMMTHDSCTVRHPSLHCTAYSMRTGR